MDSILLDGLLETLFMVFAALFLGAAIGIPAGTFLFVTRRGSLFERPWIHKLLSVSINVARSLPFIIMLVLLIPLTRWVMGTSIGTEAAIIPLGFGVAPFIARLVETSFCEVPRELIEIGQAMGASNFQIIQKILWKESIPSLIRGLTLTLVSLIGYSAMAGAIGGGGLGDLAIRYGYQRFDTRMMLETTLVLVLLVQVIQLLGDFLARRLDHRVN